jgi:hypothetical protein
MPICQRRSCHHGLALVGATVPALDLAASVEEAAGVAGVAAAGVGAEAAGVFAAGAGGFDFDECLDFVTAALHWRLIREVAVRGGYFGDPS